MTEHLLRTPLYHAHLDAQARMVDFAGYFMPVSYEGVKPEHLHTRAYCGLFDVSHMGQAILKGEGADQVLETLTGLDPASLKIDQQKYTLLLNEDGGIIDDLMVTRIDDQTYYLVVNAGCKQKDFALIGQHIDEDTTLEILHDHALLALQGPRAVEVLELLIAGVKDLWFMQSGLLSWQGQTVRLSRSGYSGEDGFELSLPSQIASDFWRALLENELVKPAGLGARDSLRLEAGLPLYGHDMDETTDPFEAGLGFGILKSRLNKGNLKGASRLLAGAQGKLARKRIGLVAKEGPPMREGARLLSRDGQEIGTVTSGSPSPSRNDHIAMGYVLPEFSHNECEILVEVRAKTYVCHVHPLPFVAHRYVRKPLKS